MTTHPIDTEALRREALGQLGRAATDPRWPCRVLALLDLLAAAEHRATRTEAQSAIRGRAVAISRQRAEAWQKQYDYDMRQENERADAAEARIKAVREVHWPDKALTGHICAEDSHDWPCPTIRALDGGA